MYQTIKIEQKYKCTRQLKLNRNTNVLDRQLKLNRNTNVLDN